MIFGLHHVALVSEDVGRLARFYCDHLGFEVAKVAEWEAGVTAFDINLQLSDTAAKMVLLRTTGGYLEMFQFFSPQARSRDLERKQHDPGLMHLCLEVSDIDSEYRRLTLAGMQFHAPPFADDGVGARAMFGRDPDGNVIEFLEILNAESNPGIRSEYPATDGAGG